MAGLNCNHCEEKIPHSRRAKKRLKETTIICPACYNENELDQGLLSLAKFIFYVAIGVTLCIVAYDIMNDFPLEPLFTAFVGLIPIVIYPLLAMFLFRVEPG
ncbi:hypothetical protein [Natribacillus halophilus]|uniref:Cxxc_20_cxxc protein n=1 Tax=Natribacillus halophilus TaxID=549003 RepID=A0A1G8Q9Y2_9BACI|nr:hypothetical protein [Natribacillus halophilus]SDJ01373.1 hypothetical protein SAMN04488123_11125 [Natribacillus halophilus]